MEIQKSILKICMKKGFLLDKEVLENLNVFEEKDAKEFVERLGEIGIEERVFTKSVFFKNIEKIKKMFVYGKDRMLIEQFFINFGYSISKIESLEDSEKTFCKNENEKNEDVKVLFSPIIAPKKISVQDFVRNFRSRYEQISKILQQRSLENLSSIRKISKKGNYCIIACVLEKRITKNKNLLLEVEDLTGSTRVLVNRNKEEVFHKAKDLLQDDIVAFNVSGSREILFANDVIFPDSFLPEKKSSKKDVSVAFISDIHSGSNMFLEENFAKFIKWLNGEEGSEEQRKVARSVRYLFINGDLVDGVGHFPGQEKWLSIPDFGGQYKLLGDYLKLIRKDVKIIIAPGNHDAVWLGEPQPIIDEKWAPELHKMKNVTLVTNPCLVEVDGFKILMYHGASMHGMVGEIEDLRVKYKTDFPTQIGREILKRRHLAPTHGIVDYIPGEKDSLVIEQVPDILTTADLHRSEVGVYNNILIIATSCWQSKTPFQEKVGNNPDYCKVPVINLKTREIKILDFGGDDEDRN